MKRHPASFFVESVILSAGVLLAWMPDVRGAADIDVKIVNYPQLAQAIRENKGKVIVVDFWANWCVPCKREFPTLVKLHEKYAKYGLVAVSVNLNDPPLKGNKYTPFPLLLPRNPPFTHATP